MSIRCVWTAVTDKPPKKIPKYIPLHVRKKMKEKPAPKFFEVEPMTGILLPGKEMDIKVIFMPGEEVCHYTLSRSSMFVTLILPLINLCAHVAVKLVLIIDESYIHAWLVLVGLPNVYSLFMICM